MNTPKCHPSKGPCSKNQPRLARTSRTATLRPVLLLILVPNILATMPTEFWRRLQCPRTVCAPMVDASELAFRSLVQDFGCDLGYTPMMHGALMSRDPNYRERQISENFSEELDLQNSEWVHGILDRPGMEEVHLDVSDQTGRLLSTAELALHMSSVGPSIVNQINDSGLETVESGTCERKLYEVHRDIAFRHRVRRPRRVFSQFSGNVGTIVLDGARHVQQYCDAIDLNFGCPQDIARRGRYGAFLLEEWPIMKDLVSTLYCHLDIPVTCKIRKVGSDENTVALAKMLQDHGAQVLTVHGRTRHQKQQFTGPVDRNIIRKIKDSLRIPVVANGGIETFQDVAVAFEETGADAVMSSEGLLENPAVFSETQPDMMTLADLYLQKCERYPCPDKFIRKHLFDLLFRRVNVHIDIRDRLASECGIDSFRNILRDLRSRQNEFGHSEEFYVSRPSWYTRHRTAAENQRVKSQSDENVSNQASLEDSFGGGCLFGDF